MYSGGYDMEPKGLWQVEYWVSNTGNWLYKGKGDGDLKRRL